MNQIQCLLDRESAARRLAQRLHRLKGSHPLILAVPRGAAPMGKILAEELEGDLDMVLVRKLGAPGEPELAIGAVDESGEIVLHADASSMGIDAPYVEEEARRQLDVIRRRRVLYTPDRGPLDAEGRTVVLVDDGVATGATLVSALRTVRRQRPAELIVAAGVISTSALARLRRLADEVVCLLSTDEFFSVSQFFVDFRQVNDDEVVAILREHERSRVGPAAAAGVAKGGRES